MTNEISNRHNYGLFDPFWNNFVTDNFNHDSTALHGELKADISESPKAYKAVIETPGLTKKDVKVGYHDDTLTVTADKTSFEDHANEKEDTVMLSERTHSTVQRAFRLPNVAVDKISAKQEAGMLTITLPKQTEHKADFEVDVD
ncbi:Hsp20 family protein [Lactiplantibacillus plantarum]|uniref:Hsp20 family protein n=1 Tax=Lactiplantibacillus plantarum TaxID=1590 RepID=UPI001BA6AFAE|nr:Hsp20 family protein [Lactiplantibacillus plantarum]MBS0953375.1 Hsp20 family protein [Lactiplantibacillus plantarum]MBS0956474.1 Hsp20 family protein [Lactiplantibacillus plantarum]